MSAAAFERLTDLYIFLFRKITVIISGPHCFKFFTVYLSTFSIHYFIKSINLQPLDNFTFKFIFMAL